MLDAIVLRGIERVLIVLAATVFAYLGYRLFSSGSRTQKASGSLKSGLISFTLSGAAPGLFFMAFGAAILTYALVSGRAKVSESELAASNEELDLRLNEQEQQIAAMREEVRVIRMQELQMRLPEGHGDDEDIGLEEESNQGKDDPAEAHEMGPDAPIDNDKP